ncbi:hypothetical protein Q9L58_005783 [Maublancomyces gigas]|uniref:G domain-containing protein n=1 Tax=Discina gigas TaxID=1032678 RepID=A0ABR3GHB7_9PEZI
MGSINDSSFGSAEDTVSGYVRTNKSRSPGPIAAFIFMGKTGAGKSSMIKLLGGKTSDGSEPIVDDGLESCTTTPIIYETTIDNKMILLLDTPGFDDSEQTNLDILKEIVSNLYVFALRPTEVEVRGLIFLHDITETRLSGSQRMTWQILKAICGEGSMKNVLVGTTQWSSEGDRRFQNEEKRERELHGKHWNGIHKSSRVVYGDKENALQIIRDLLVKPPVLLLVQAEMINPPHTVEATTAGRAAMPAAFVEMERLRKEITDQQRGSEEAIRQTEETHRKEKDSQMRGQEEERIKQVEAAQRREVEKHKEQCEREKAREREEQEQRARHEEEVRGQVEEANRRAQAEEAQRQAEVEERTRLEEAARRRAEEKQRKYEIIRQEKEQEEISRQIEEAHRQIQAEEARRHAEAEERTRQQEAAQRQAEEEQRKREDARQKEEQEQLRRYEEEIRRKIEESRWQAEEAQRHAQAEAQKIKEEEMQRIETERQRWEAEQIQARRDEVERQRQLEEENNRLREEAMREQERIQREIHEANQRVRRPRLAFRRRMHMGSRN